MSIGKFSAAWRRGSPRRRLARTVVLFLLLLSLPGCRLNGTPAATPTPSATTATPTMTIAPVETATPTATPAGPIGPEEVAGLVSEAARLPVDYVANIVWPAAGQMLLQAGPELYPVTLAPLEIGAPVTLNLPGPLLAIAPDASSAAAIAPNGRLALYNLSGGLLQEVELEGVYFANYSADSRWLAAGEPGEMAVRVIDTAAGEQVARLTGFETAAPIYSAMVRPGGGTLLWWARATLQFQDVASGALGERLGYQDFVIDFAFDPDGSRLAIAVMGQIDVRSVPDAQQEASLSLSQPVHELTFSPDGRLLAAAYGTTVQLWDTATWQPLPPLAGGQAAVMRVAFSPDGQSIVSLDDAGQLMVWKRP